MKKLRETSFDYFAGKIFFGEDVVQNVLVFQPIYRYFKRVGNSDYSLSWKSKGSSDESITASSALHNFLNPSLSYLGTRIRLRFSRN